MLIIIQKIGTLTAYLGQIVPLKAGLIARSSNLDIDEVALVHETHIQSLIAFCSALIHGSPAM